MVLVNIEYSVNNRYNFDTTRRARVDARSTSPTYSTPGVSGGSERMRASRPLECHVRRSIASDACWSFQHARSSAISRISESFYRDLAARDLLWAEERPGRFQIRAANPSVN